MLSEKKKNTSSLVGVVFDTDRNGKAPTATVAMVTCSRDRDFRRVKLRIISRLLKTLLKVS